MLVLHRPHELAPFHGGVFVPTMGALHDGHAALVRAAASLARPRGAPVVVSIFVNPTQFNDASDFARYPRTLQADAERCAAAGADVVWAPAVEDVYPPGAPGPPPLPAVATEPGLEDRARPGHFAGVCQVVRRLFEVVRPATALFGEKDWQQLRVVTDMTRDLGLGVEVVGLPTVREADGLAMSSRNRFLSPAERSAASAVPAALCDACGCKRPQEAEAAMRARLEGAGLAVEYAVVRDARTLLPLAPGVGAGRALVAARAGSVRLIDNAPWPS